jgi:hypothetical protein
MEWYVYIVAWLIADFLSILGSLVYYWYYSRKEPEGGK